MAFMLVGPFFIVILLALSFLSQAQNIPIVRGAVVDVTGAAVPGVPLLLGTPQGIVLAHAITDMHGKFSLSRLSTGEVELVIAPYSGFAAKTLPIRGTDLVTNVTLVLKLQTVNQEVNVDGASLSRPTHPLTVTRSRSQGQTSANCRSSTRTLLPRSLRSWTRPAAPREASF